MSVPNYAFASDNAAGLCPEALAALIAANPGCAASYGDDAHTAEAKRLLRELFETDCEIFFVFNGTAANALALAACCRSSHTRILCHEMSHVDTDECGAPEFFTHGAKITALPGPAGKLAPATVERALHLGHGVHFPKPAVLSLTQSTELGTVYNVAEIAALTSLAHAHGLAVHLDGARFANAIAALQLKNQNSKTKTPTPPGTRNPELGTFASAADATWRAGVDVLCFGGTKNGMASTEAVVFFNRELAREFEYRVKQGGQLASKLRFAAAQWAGMLRDGAWLRHAAHANACARRLADALRAVPGLRLLHEPEVNGVFVEMPPALHAALAARGWHFYRFVGDHGYRLMCSWATTDADLAAFLADLRELNR